MLVVKAHLRGYLDTRAHARVTNWQYPDNTLRTHHTMSQVRLIVRHARQIVQVCRNKEARLIGKEMNNVCVMTCDECGDEGLSLIISHDGLILDVGTDREIAVKYDGVKAEREINARNKSILPGESASRVQTICALVVYVMC